MNSTVKDIMTTHVAWVRRDAPFKEIAARLRVPGERVPRPR
jgi:hypothetical protein